MYIKKILLAIVFIGLIVASIFAYYVYKTMMDANTAFKNDTAYVFIATNSTYDNVREQLEPLLKDIKTFDALAKQKKYDVNVKAGRYAIKKGMNNNDIIIGVKKAGKTMYLPYKGNEKLVS